MFMFALCFPIARAFAQGSEYTEIYVERMLVNK